MSTGERQNRREAESQLEDGYCARETKSNYQWATIGSDCPILRDYLVEKEGTGWTIGKILVSFTRGFAQTGFANNPITGIIFMITLVSVAPGTFAVCSATGFLGHIISIMLKEPAVNIENGLTVFNPLIFGAVSYYFIPIIYGGFDGFSTLFVVLGVVIIAYFWRACGNGAVPCLTMPFNVVQLITLITLKHARSERVISNFGNTTLFSVDNATESAAAIAEVMEASQGIVENATVVISSLDWGMVVRASVTSASQLFVTESVPFGAIIYLAVLIYSPFTCLFGFLGSLGTSLVGLQMGAPPETVYAGLWGFNGYLTAASMGGSFLVLNKHVVGATVVAIILTGLMQHVLQILFAPAGLPVGTIPFVLTTWLFIGLGKAPGGAFSYPITMSSPEKQRREYLTCRRAAKLQQMRESGEPEVLLSNGKTSLT